MRQPRFPVSWHRLWQPLLDAGLVAFAYTVAFQLRFDTGVPVYYERLFERTLLLVLLLKLVVFLLFGLYDHWWRYVSVRDMWRIARAVTVSSLIAVLAIYLANPVPVRLPRSVFIIDWILVLGLVAGVRLLARTVIERPRPRDLVARGKEALIVGAGDAGQLVIREMLRNHALGYTPIGLVDDDPRKQHMRLQGVRVLGSTDDLPALLTDSRPDEVIIAIPSAAGEARQRIVEICRDAGVPMKTLPGVHELIAGDTELARQLREVQVEDVLGREAVELDLAAISSYIAGETVLVTGAGGSIGSELCRQLVSLGVESLVLVEHAEVALVEIERDLAERGFMAAIPVLADAKSRQRMRQLCEHHRPAVVFHAAAYKHVPIMEANAVEAVRNNVLATRVLAEVAAESGVKRFVLVSTDKAVNPKNVLGQSKLLCEWVVESAGAREHLSPGAGSTRFISVRFGNVLGSSGSVIPLFRRQIARGGPVTVTHREMTRYFMTIPEAAQLIIQAGAIGDSGDVFVLDMGEPVRIVELARDMIRLSGKEPDRDVAIDFVGTRPGEKLHEELWADSELSEPTSHPKIMRRAARPVDPLWLEQELGELERLAEDGDSLQVVARLSELAHAPRLLAAQDAGAAPTASGAAARAAEPDHGAGALGRTGP